MTLPSSLSIDDKIMTSSNNATREGNITFNTATTMKSAPPPFPPATAEEAKRRFNLALTKGVETLFEQGHGRDRASTELLNEIANGCSPDEEEIFQTMLSLGLSLDDATKVITVSTAFRSAAARPRATTTHCSTTIAIEAIDDLTSRLNLANLLRGGGASSPILAYHPHLPPTTTSTITSMDSTTDNIIQATEVAVVEFQPRLSAHSTATAKTAHQTTTTRNSKKINQPHQLQAGGSGRGRKRALADKTPELRDRNVIITEKQPSTTTKAIDPIEEKEKILNAKLSKIEGSGSSSTSASSCAARSKSPDGGGGGIGGARGMRGSSTVSVNHDEEMLIIKRPRTRSQTEESIREI